MLRRRFFTAFAAPFVPVTTTAKETIPPVFMHPHSVQLVFEGKTAVSETFNKVFPRGAVASVENVQKLFEAGWNLFDFKAIGCPITGRFVDEHGDTHYYRNGLRHNENGPAMISKDGKIVAYYKNDLLHNTKGPAFFHEGVCSYYYENGLSHRTDGPAEYRLGSLPRKMWAKNGKEHRVGGAAQVIKDYCFIYKVEGRIHNDDGPAYVTTQGLFEWYVNGKQTMTQYNSREKALELIALEWEKAGE